jgi:PhnB protein
MPIEPYLNFDGRCEEAIEFYKKALGAEVIMLMRYKDSPEPPPPGHETPGDKIMHSTLRVGDSQIMASDGFCMGKTEFKGISLSLPVSDEATAERAFKALSDGGQVNMPLTETFFAKRFAMLTDRFGVHWMIIASKH